MWAQWPTCILLNLANVIFGLATARVQKRMFKQLVKKIVKLHIVTIVQFGKSFMQFVKIGKLEIAKIGKFDWTYILFTLILLTLRFSETNFYYWIVSTVEFGKDAQLLKQETSLIKHTRLNIYFPTMISKIELLHSKSLKPILNVELSSKCTVFDIKKAIEAKSSTWNLTI